MSNEKFTRGPWELGDENNGSAEVMAGETTISFDRMARHNSNYVISREEMLANAHLTMAAPDMYEALKIIAGSHPDSNPQTLIKLAQTVINKVH